MMTDQEYETQEARRHKRFLDRVESDTLAARKDGREAWATLLTGPEELDQRALWLFDGSYGWGAKRHAERITTEGGNTVAKLGQLIAAVESRCPSAMARAAWVELDPVNRGIADSILAHAISRATLPGPDGEE